MRNKVRTFFPCAMLLPIIAVAAVLLLMSLRHNPLNSDSAMAAEQQYTIMEENLQMQLENFESRHPEYHEYRYDLDSIGHDPVALIAILSAIHGDSFSFGDVQQTLDMIFREQYILTQHVQSSRRYVKGKEIDYYTCCVSLENRPLEQLAPLILCGEQYKNYSTIMKRFGSQ